MSRPAMLLVVLLAVLGGVLAYQTWGGGPAAPAPAASNPETGAAGPDAIDPVADVRLDLLQAKPDAYKPPQRNPFRFYTPPAPVVRRAPPPPPPPQVAPRDVGPPPLPPIRIRYFGYLRLENGTVYAQLRLEPNGAQVNAKAGDIVDGRYRLLSVSPDFIEVAYLDGRGRQRIVRSGQ